MIKKMSRRPDSLGRVRLVVPGVEKLVFAKRLSFVINEERAVTGELFEDMTERAFRTVKVRGYGKKQQTIEEEVYSLRPTYVVAFSTPLAKANVRRKKVSPPAATEIAAAAV